MQGKVFIVTTNFQLTVVHASTYEQPFRTLQVTSLGSFV